MNERVIFTNLFAILIMMAGCLLSHVAGMKYYARIKSGATLIPAVISTVEAIVLMIVAIILVQLN